jgi:predicted secreted protein
MIVHGKGGAVKIVSSGEVLVAAMTEWRLTSNADEVDITSFGDSDKVWMAGFKDGQLTFNGFYDSEDTNGQGALHQAFVEGTEVDIKLYATATEGFSGKGVVTSREVGASVGGAVTCNFGLRVNGAITPFSGTA